MKHLLPTLATLALASCSSLPDTHGRAASHAVTGTGDTPLGRAAGQFVPGDPDTSGIHALARGQDALAARLALAGAASRSLDVQYYIWHHDESGLKLAGELLRAADRGVRVRMLLDDIGTTASDDALLLLESHPNIEVRLFNPVATRSAPMLGVLLNYRSANRRMHNKAFIADNQAAIVGGRNVGDEYFGAHGEMNFADLDVVAIGPVVGEVSREFDLYWNSPSSIAVTALTGSHDTPDQVAARRRTLEAKHAAASQPVSRQAGGENPITSQIRRGNLSFVPGRAWVMYDHPAKITSAPQDRSTHLGPKLRRIAGETRHSLFIVSPYFIPGKEGVAWLAGLRQRGVRVVVLTNSLASTDVAPVHAAYKRYRKALLRAQVEVYELKPYPGTQGPSTALRGSSRAGLHAKTFAFDDRAIFVGSMNLDPRSVRLNTEVGVLVESPQLATRLTRKVMEDIANRAYHLRMEGRRVVWLTNEAGRSVRFTTEPETSAWQRLKTAIVGLLPIEGQL